MFYTIARGSAFETESHLLYGNSVGYFSDESIEQLNLKIGEIIKDLNFIMKSLENSPKSNPQP